MRKETVAIACTCSDGTPTLISYKVEVTEKDYDLGIHYDVAKDLALEDNFEGPWVYFDSSEHNELFNGVNNLVELLTFE